MNILVGNKRRMETKNIWLQMNIAFHQMNNANEHLLWLETKGGWKIIMACLMKPQLPKSRQVMSTN